MKRITGIFRRAALLAVPMLFSITAAMAQSEKITLPSRTMTRGEAIGELEKQLEKRFGYNDNFDLTERITFAGGEMTLEQAVRTIAGSGFDFVFTGRQILFVDRKEAPQAAPADDGRLRRAAIDFMADGEAERSTGSLPANSYRPATARNISYGTRGATPSNLYEGNRMKAGLKTNLLYLATTTPNIGLEFSLSDRVSLDLGFGYNGFKFKKDGNSNPKLMHWSAMADARYWFCRVFEGTFMGVHGIYGKFNVENIPIIRKPDFRAKGYAVGGGISVGHHWAIGRRWGFELSAGAGALYLDYDKFDCGECGVSRGHDTKWYFGPTKCTASFIFFIQ